MMNTLSTSLSSVLPTSSYLRGKNDHPTVDAPHPETNPG